jgi:hypothetical protein
MSSSEAPAKPNYCHCRIIILRIRRVISIDCAKSIGRVFGVVISALFREFRPALKVIGGSLDGERTHARSLMVSENLLYFFLWKGSRLKSDPYELQVI